MLMCFTHQQAIKLELILAQSRKTPGCLMHLNPNGNTSFFDVAVLPGAFGAIEGLESHTRVRFCVNVNVISILLLI